MPYSNRLRLLFVPLGLALLNTTRLRSTPHSSARLHLNQLHSSALQRSSLHSFSGNTYLFTRLWWTPLGSASVKTHHNRRKIFTDTAYIFYEKKQAWLCIMLIWCWKMITELNTYGWICSSLAHWMQGDWRGYGNVNKCAQDGIRMRYHQCVDRSTLPLYWVLYIWLEHLLRIHIRILECF